MGQPQAKPPHDTLFTTPLDANARFSFDEQVVACFPDMIRRSVPGYGQMLAMLPILPNAIASFAKPIATAIKSQPRL